MRLRQGGESFSWEPFMPQCGTTEDENSPPEGCRGGLSVMTRDIPRSPRAAAPLDRGDFQRSRASAQGWSAVSDNGAIGLLTLEAKAETEPLNGRAFYCQHLADTVSLEMLATSW